MDHRLQQLTSWIESLRIFPDFEIKIASGDASFRRYFRISHMDNSLIAMDAPPKKEAIHPFIMIARAFKKIGINVPEIMHQNSELGFLLITDFGNRQYLPELTSDTVDRLYGDALSALMILQACGPVDNRIPVYNNQLLFNEMELFREWYLQKHLGIKLNVEQNNMLDDIFELLVQEALSQPSVCVHRDYHSRNLMLTEQHNPGVLDFQDAVIGPVTYDVVSLLKDCYIAWSEDQIEDWLKGYYQLSVQSGVIQSGIEFRQYRRWFDWMGIQRHLKASGIFARLNHRDHKPNYLDDIPRTLNYIVQASLNYPELKLFGQFIARVI